MAAADIIHTVKVRVRYADTDQMGVANNAMYFTWFEVGRTEYLRKTGMTYRSLEEQGFMLPVRETRVKYLKPALYDDVLDIDTKLDTQKGVRLRFCYTVSRGDDVLATGLTEHVFTDNELRPIRPPKEMSDLNYYIAKHYVTSQAEDEEVLS